MSGQIAGQVNAVDGLCSTCPATRHQGQFSVEETRIHAQTEGIAKNLFVIDRFSFGRSLICPNKGPAGQLVLPQFRFDEIQWSLESNSGTKTKHTQINIYSVNYM